jgi:hypothetical protein
MRDQLEDQLEAWLDTLEDLDPEAGNLLLDIKYSGYDIPEGIRRDANDCEIALQRILYWLRDENQRLAA